MSRVLFVPWTRPAGALAGSQREELLCRQVPCLLASVLDTDDDLEVLMSWPFADGPGEPDMRLAPGLTNDEHSRIRAAARERGADYVIWGYATFTTCGDIRLRMTRVMDGEPVLAYRYTFNSDEIPDAVNAMAAHLARQLGITAPTDCGLTTNGPAMWEYLAAQEATLINRMQRNGADPEAPFQHCLSALRLDAGFTAAEEHVVGLAVDYGLSDQGPAAVALSALRELVRLNPGNDTAWGALGYIALRFGGWSEAVSALERCRKMEPDGLPVELALGRAYRELGHYTEAISCLQAALDRAGEEKEILLDMAAVLHVQGDPEAALTYLQRALTLDPQDGISHANLGMVLMEMGRIEAAEAAFRAGYNVAPENWALLCSYSCLLEQTERYPAMAELLLQALKVADSQERRATTAGRLALAVAETLVVRPDLERWARGIMSDALTVAPSSAHLLWQAAVCYMEAGMDSQAETTLRRLLEVHPGTHAAHNLLGCLLAATGRTEEATSCFARAHHLAPEESSYTFNWVAALSGTESGDPRTGVGPSREPWQG